MLKCALRECTIAFMDILFKFTDSVCKFEPGHYDDWDEIIERLESEDCGDDVPMPIKRAVEKKIMADSEREAYRNSIRQVEDSILAFSRKVWSQFETQIVNPLSELVNDFNQQYSGNEKLSLSRHSFSSDCDTNDVSIYMGKQWMMRIHVETVPYGSMDPQSGMIIRDSSWILHNRGESPSYRGNRIIAWGTLKYNDGRGHNLLLVEDDSSGYGTWHLMKNMDNGFGRGEYGSGPFAFELDKLNREIQCIDAFHIYNSEVSVFDPNMCLEELPY